jgi:hypothetical protein
MQLSTLLTLTLSSLATLTTAKPYHGQYNWTAPIVPGNHTGKPCSEGSTPAAGAAHPTGTGWPSKTTSTLPVFTGAAYKPQSEMLGLVLAIGGGVALLV